MPNTRSAAKHVRADGKNRLRNETVTSELHTLVKKLRIIVKDNPEKARDYARLVIKKLDKAASNKVIPRERSDRKKARIACLLAKSKITL